MAMTPEGKVKEKVKRVLTAHDVYYFMPVQTGYGARTLDFLCCKQGKFFAIETKAWNKKPTPIQDVIIDRIELAGGKTFVIDGSTEELVRWLKDTF